MDVSVSYRAEETMTSMASKHEAKSTHVNPSYFNFMERFFIFIIQ